MILFCVLCISSITLLPGPKISQNVNYTQRGTMEGPKAPSETRTSRRTAEGDRVGSGKERRSPSPVWGSGGIPPENFEI